MRQLPRVAVGTLLPGADSHAMTWALLDLFSREQVQVQHFLSRACFEPADGASVITGLCSRHLDSWLMSREVCREIFELGFACNDLAVVEGVFSPPNFATCQCGSRLELLCEWLGLARVGILDVSRLGACRFPDRPRHLDGVLLDQVSDEADYFALQTHVESLWGVPVIGGLSPLPRLRRALAELPPGSAPTRDQLRCLGDNLAQTCRLDLFRTLASRHPWVNSGESSLPEPSLARRVRVAVAYDAAFHCYFPDTLDVLESRGAEVVDFSPLRDESLPADTDIVYFGCGHPERFATELAGNHCMNAALRNHVCAGRRVYAEGGGLAYLCRHVRLPDGALLPMVGALPAVAQLNAMPVAPYPIEAKLASNTWLADKGVCLRGYLNSTWTLEPAAELVGYVAQPGGSFDVAGRHHAVCSRIHFNFAAQPRVLGSFLRQHAPSLKVGSCRTTPN